MKAIIIAIITAIVVLVLSIKKRANRKFKNENDLFI